MKKTKLSTLVIFFFIISLFSTYAQENLLKNQNPECDGTSYYKFGSATKYNATNTHTNDGSGSFKFTGQGSTFLNNSVKVYADLVAGRRYVFRAYMRMTNAPNGQNILVKGSHKDGSGPTEMHWNTNELDEWEEILLPYIALKDGRHYFTIFTWPKYMHTTDGEYGKSDGSNLSLCPTVYIDDFSVVELTSENITSSEPETPKTPFVSEYIKVDAEGNFTLKEDGKWVPIFPRLAYQSWYGDFATESARMAEYGFNGWANITSGRLSTAVAQGMKYNAIQINKFEETKSLINTTLQDMEDGIVPKTSVILYVIDNEMHYLCQYDDTKQIGPWLDSNDTDGETGRRGRPVFSFNGQAEGIARAYKNSNNNLMDITGSYVSASGEAEDFRYNPNSNISLLRNSHKQSAPAVFIDVQSYYHNAYIPAIFKGIANGAKGLIFWRGGTEYRGSKKDFRENVWAPALKGADGVFARIDSMLPIIKQPLETSWSASISPEQKEIIAIGTRDNGDKHYIILSNFSASDEEVVINFENINITGAVDFFTSNKIGTINGNVLTVNIGHFNDGYLVLEITGTVSTAISTINKSSFKIYPNPANNQIFIEHSDVEIKSIKLIGTTGAIVKTFSNFENHKSTINISDILKGLYILQITTIDNNVSARKLIIS